MVTPYAWRILRRKKEDPSKCSFQSATPCISSNNKSINAKGACSIKLPCDLMDCNNSEESPSPSRVLVFPLTIPTLNAKKIARIVINDVYKSVISIYKSV
jgi:hypothetical protein